MHLWGYRSCWLPADYWLNGMFFKRKTYRLHVKLHPQVLLNKMTRKLFRHDHVFVITIRGLPFLCITLQQTNALNFFFKEEHLNEYSVWAAFLFWIWHCGIRPTKIPVTLSMFEQQCSCTMLIWLNISKLTQVKHVDEEAAVFTDKTQY